MSEQVVPSADAQRIVVKFLTNGNVKPTEILMTLRAQFGDEPLSKSQMYDWSKSFKERRTEVENMRRLHLMKVKLWPRFLRFSGRLIHRFYDRKTNHQRSLLFEASLKTE
jgi:hypothetical protein